MEEQIALEKRRGEEEFARLQDLILMRRLLRDAYEREAAKARAVVERAKVWLEAFGEEH